MAWLDDARGALIDVDGTLLRGDVAIAGAAEALQRLRRRGLPFRLVTNTTRRSRAAVARVLSEAGIRVAPEEVLLPAHLARQRILASGRLRARLLVPEEAARDFHGVIPDAVAPDWVVVGDLGSGFTWEVLNSAFACLRAGAALLALHKNRFWHAGERGVVIDAGAFVAGLEYAAAVSAEVVGKPELQFFRLCLADLGLQPREVVVVGDDPVNDAEGGRAAGCRTILVRTGKLEGHQGALPQADQVLGSIAELG